jgi:RNA polymerase sigma factor (sigma-70 family)
MSQHLSKAASDRRRPALNRLTDEDSAMHAQRGDRRAFLELVDRNAVKTEIRHLPTVYREVLVLRYLDHLSLPDLADRLGVTVTTVKSRLFRGQTELQCRMTRGATSRRPNPRGC